jgi:hypothetical protein
MISLPPRENEGLSHKADEVDLLSSMLGAKKVYSDKVGLAL